MAACNSDDAQAQCFAAGAIGKADTHPSALPWIASNPCRQDSASSVDWNPCLDIIRSRLGWWMHSMCNRGTPFKGSVLMLRHEFAACIGKLVNFGGEPAHLLLQAQAPSALMTMLEGTKAAGPVRSSLSMPAHCSTCMRPYMESVGHPDAEAAPVCSVSLHAVDVSLVEVLTPSLW